MRASWTAIAAAGVLIAGATAPLGAGPLDPPPGPVDSTYKTLDDVEPRTPLTPEFVSGNSTAVFQITAPGHYYLTGDVLVPASQNGIVIDANNVVVNLNGYTIRGLAGSSDGITTAGAQSFITIRNGFINAVLVGIRLQGSSSQVLIEDITITGAGDDGIQGSADIVVRRCDIVSQRDGIDVAGRCTIEDSLINAADDAIQGGNQVIVRNNDIRGATDGTGDGVEVGFESLVEGNVVVVVNGGRGIRAPSSTVRNNSVKGQGATTGIDSSGITSGNIVSCFSTGIDQIGGLITGNQVSGTTARGISAGDARVEGNTVTINVGTGIRALNHVTITGNTIVGDDDGGTGGIVAAGVRAVIKNNTLAQLGDGVSSSANRLSLIAGNVATNVGNAFDFVDPTGNVLGPVETLNALSTTITTTSPFANFDYE